MSVKIEISDRELANLILERARKLENNTHFKNKNDMLKLTEDVKSLERFLRAFKVQVLGEETNNGACKCRSKEDQR